MRFIRYPLLTKREVKMARYWLFFAFFMDREEVEVDENAKN